ncbi:MAG: helix-turn-helix domain-containing protein [Planctomycetes bacterium]|nr:helix-turn-helix domain-containing protein [Planctomycetota bacterium]
MPGTELLTVKETAEALQVSVFTVRRLIKKGDLPAARVAHQFRVRREDLEKYIARHLERFGNIAVKPFFYRIAVLERYRSDPMKFYLHDSAFSGKLGLKEHLYKFQNGARNTVYGEPLFCELSYKKVHLKDGEEAELIDSSKDYRKIAAWAEEQIHWHKHFIQRPEFLVAF